MLEGSLLKMCNSAISILTMKSANHNAAIPGVLSINWPSADILQNTLVFLVEVEDTNGKNSLLAMISDGAAVHANIRTSLCSANRTVSSKKRNAYSVAEPKRSTERVSTVLFRFFCPPSLEQHSPSADLMAESIYVGHFAVAQNNDHTRLNFKAIVTLA